VNHAKSFDLLQSPTVAPAWPEHFCGRVSEDHRATAWPWVGAPTGSEGGSGSLQDSAEYTNRSRQPWSTTKESQMTRRMSGTDCPPNQVPSLVWPRMVANRDCSKDARHRRTGSGLSRCSRGSWADGFLVQAQVRTNFVLDRQWRC